MLHRRELLSLSAGVTALAAARRAWSIGELSQFRFGALQLDHSGTHPRPTSLRKLAWEIDKRTSIQMDVEPRVVQLHNAQLADTPFLTLIGDREFSLPPTPALDNLRAFLTFGGFLLIDSAEGRADGAFDRSVRKLVAALFPTTGQNLTIVPNDHVLYRSFYRLNRPYGRVATSPVLEAVTQDDRLMVVYSHNDMAGAWARDNFGNWEFRCDPNGERQRELAFRLGVNVVMYALCLAYKADQVHVEYIMKRRRWRPGGP